MTSHKNPRGSIGYLKKISPLRMDGNEGKVIEDARIMVEFEQDKKQCKDQLKEIMIEVEAKEDELKRMKKN